MKKRDQKKYKKYMDSKEWRELREKVLDKRGRVCQLCNTIHNLHLHHLTYARLYKEREIDLLIVCKSCHESIHGRTFASKKRKAKEKPLKPIHRKERINKSLSEQYLEALARDIMS